MLKTNEIKDNTSLINQYTVSELFGLVYDELNGLVHYLALRYSQSTTEILMDKDEIVGELYLELWKGVQYYHERGLPLPQMISVVKVMLSNRIAELKYRYYKTHRRISQLNISIDVTINGIDVDERLDINPSQEFAPTGLSDPADIFDSVDYVNTVRARLDIRTQEVFDAVVYGHEQLMIHVWLSSVRANAAYKTNRNTRIKPYHIASALCRPEDEVKVAMQTISAVMEEVQYDS